MRQLSSTLTAAQKAASRIPYVKLEARDRIAGIVRLAWNRLYTGSEDDYHHALTMPGDGSMIRARITPPGDARKLYRQRVADPGPSPDFGTWTYTTQYNCVVVAAASQGTEVSVFWINSSREIRRIKSTDSEVCLSSSFFEPEPPRTRTWNRLIKSLPLSFKGENFDATIPGKEVSHGISGPRRRPRRLPPLRRIQSE